MNDNMHVIYKVYSVKNVEVTDFIKIYKKTGR